MKGEGGEGGSVMCRARVADGTAACRNVKMEIDADIVFCKCVRHIEAETRTNELHNAPSEA